MLSFIKSSDGYNGQVSSITLTEGAEQMKERLGAIIENGGSYTYVQRGYYYNSFIIKMGWNLNNNATDWRHTNATYTNNRKTLVTKITYAGSDDIMSLAKKVLYEANAADRISHKAFDFMDFAT